VEGDKGAAARKEGAAGKEGNDKSELPPSAPKGATLFCIHSEK